MTKKTNLVNSLRCLHYSTDLPVSIFSNNEIKFSLPKTITTVHTILNDKNTIPLYSKDTDGIQIIHNEYKESYICVVIDKSTCALIGPFLIETIESGTLTNMVRDGLIPFHQKSNLTNYYQQCIVLNDVKLNYIVQLLNYLDIANTIDLDDEHDASNDVDNELYKKQKSEYRRSEFLHSPYEIESEISKYISNGDFESANKILKEINLAPHAKLASSSLRSFKNSMICSCAFMTRAAISGGVNSDAAFTLSDTYINQIEDMQTIKELQQFESKMAEGFTNMVKDIKSNTYSPSILNVIYYIENHLCEDLNAKTLANVAYLNPSYLSSLFHKETGVTLSEWIIKKRINEAAYHVLNSKEDISDIAFFYKFCSQSYFVQCFKKIIGVTPGEYRKGKQKQ